MKIIRVSAPMYDFLMKTSKEMNTQDNRITRAPYGYVPYHNKFYDISPPDAYHKDDCIAFLGSGEEAIKQLSDWVDELKKLGVEMHEYETGFTGLQGLISGKFSYTLKIKETTND